MSRFRWRAWVLWAALALAAVAERPGVAWAEGEGGGHGKGSSGNVQIFKEALDLGIWTVVVFVLLFFVLRKFAWGPMLQGLQKREESIHLALEEAQKGREEAQRLRDQFQGEMNRAHDRAREIHEEARRNAERAANEMIAKARSEIQAEHERRRRELDIARDQALQQLWSQTAQLATLVSAKAIRRQLTPDDHRRFVDEAIAELQQAGTQHKQQAASIRA
jgi:F-type H+-transporting ATPase subunit b